MRGRTEPETLSGAGRILNLPMYELPEMAAANDAFLAELEHRLDSKGVRAAGRIAGEATDTQPHVLFTQVCGYPLLKYHGDEYRVLATPHYAMPGCAGSHHRAFVMVRADDAAASLADLRGRVFGCNSLFSNTGMNLPRLSFARIAGGKPFFSSVVVTGAHVASLQRLDEATIDVCSIDSVTWGYFRQLRPTAATRYRILTETLPSPSLPFVTSAATTEADAAVLAETLREMMRDPGISHIREPLRLTDVSAPDLAAYWRLIAYEAEAAELGYPELA
ncbi:PhnD/SsuA/transferrin family substrate-binding protein [Bradyrhizobium sp. B097]|uniref:phosphate/phosphite/phosphonate ABC transporter substrate-binding protein n=1 Tax=Bradyrhizobium sp. B097 TaxID=3140244 RepID=UPI0031831D97